MRLRRSCGLLVISAVLACGGSDGDGYRAPTNPNSPGTPNTPGTPAAANQVSVRDNSYAPAATTVKVGTTVTWSWAAGNYSSHTVTFADGAASADQATGTYERTFNTAGTFNYQCAVHGASMSGSVTVQP